MGSIQDLMYLSSMRILSYRKRANPKTKQYAKELRKNMTPEEIILWDMLKGKATGHKFRRQAIILGWIADFYCAQSRLVVEIDGWHHYQEPQLTKDLYRDTIMRNHGFRILRFRNEDIHMNIDVVIKEILRAAGRVH